MAAAAAFPAYAQDWGQLATISSTLGVNANRLCVGEGLRSDIGCPSYAPSLTTAGDVSITGNLSANAFIGDGSGLTGMASGDRITSGTTNVIAAQDRSLTISTAGTQQVTIGENGNVGIGTSNPSVALEVTSNTVPTVRLTRSAVGSWDLSSLGTSFQIVEPGQATRLTVRQGGNVGIGTTSPQAKLQVSGSFTVSNSAQTTTPSLYVGADGKIAQGTNSPFYNFQLSNAGPYNMGISSTAGGATISLAGSAFAQIESTRGTLFLNASQSGGNMIFRTSNTERMQVTAAGNVGIGTASPQATLQVSGSFVVSTSVQTTTPSLYAATNGNVGIGTSNPTTALDISFSTSSVKAGAFGLQVFGASTANPRINLTNNAVGPTAGLTLGHESWGAMASTGSGMAVPTFRQLGIYTANNSFLEERIRILGPVGTYLGTGGLVGINTSPSTPSSTLHVSGTLRVTSWTAIAANVTPTTALDVYGTVSATAFVGDGSGLTGVTAASSDRITSGTTNIIANTNGAISFTTAGTERMVISSLGNVGIGIVSPNVSLAVAGTISATSLDIRGIDNGPFIRLTRTDGSTFSLTAGAASLFSNSRLYLHNDDAFVAAISGNQATRWFTLYNESPTSNTLALRFGTEPQALRIYNTRTDASNYERGILTWKANPNVFQIGTEAAGTGTVRNIALTGGNVGIGTTSPGKTLDVSGTAQIISRTLVGGTGTPSATLQVSGSVLLAGNDNIPCTDSVLGLVRRNPTTGRLQACR